jgi:cell wall-associated NlpC family hydrolase
MGMRRTSFRIAAVAAAALALPIASARAATLGTWNRPEQRAVVTAGVLPKLADGRFHGERSLTGAQLSGALGALAAREGRPPLAASSTATLTVTAFDARLVAQLGLDDVAAHVQATARDAGLNPPRTFGTEVVARYLGLRDDHPAPDETLELYPWDPITRAEAAHSFAVLLHSGDWAAAGARAQLSAFALPRYDAAQRTALSLAVSKIGMPYVWGGETDGVSSQFGYQAHGGYDCSGFGRDPQVAADPARRRAARRPAVLRHRVLHGQGHRAQRRPHRDRPVRPLDDQLVRPGRVRRVARRRLAPGELHLGTPHPLAPSPRPAQGEPGRARVRRPPRPVPHDRWRHALAFP